jgi:hypothetical protein
VRALGFSALAVVPWLAVAGCQQGPSKLDTTTSCARSAEVVASFEVGPQATAEQRSTSVARHQLACERASLTAAEHTCITRATDTWSVRACAPRMFEPSATGGTGGAPTTAVAGAGADASCDEVIARTRAAIVATMPAETSGNGTKMLDRMMGVMTTACSADGWPNALKRCVVATTPGDMPALQACNDQMPQDLQQKLADRMRRAMNETEPQ